MASGDGVRVHKAVIPAAGLGTRFLPATKALPKEMIPVVDKPGIQYVVEEALRSDLDEFLVVTSRGKAAMEDHFDRLADLEARLEQTDKLTELEAVRSLAELATFHYVRQTEPRGFGDAVLLARAFVGDEIFVVMVPDEIVPEPRGEEPSLLDEMIAIHERTGGSVLAVQEVPEEAVPSYGICAWEEEDGGLLRIVSMVEKPARSEAPSRLASRGRYLFTPGLFDALSETSAGVGGEIQLTDAINLLAQREPVYAYVHGGPILDVGKKLDYLRATIELALRRDDLGPDLEAWLRTRFSPDA